MTMRDLYEASAEDVAYALGLMPVSDAESVPYLHLFYQGWSREMLEFVRETFGSGLTLRFSESGPDRVDLFIATRELVEIQGGRGAETSILRAAAWDAQLHDVEAEAFHLFEAERARQGRFLVLVQTPEWEFPAGVNPDDSAEVGAVLPRALPMPSGM